MRAGGGGRRINKKYIDLHYFGKDLVQMVLWCSG